MKKFNQFVLLLVICLGFILGTAIVAMGDDGSSSQVSGTVTAQSVVQSSAQNAVASQNGAATQDDKAKRKEAQEDFKAVDPTGAFQYEYPVNLPPGTNGMAPALKLFYNSNCGNGMLGMGWNLIGIAKIERDFSYPVSYNNTDHFMYNGEKLVMGPDGYYHTAKESYERIQLVNPNTGASFWVITQKNGTKMYFGYQAAEHSAGTAGRIEGIGVSGSDKAITWSLSKVQDLQGNYYVVEYVIDGTTGAYYPTRITYTKNENNLINTYRTVEFSYETRSDHGGVYNPTYQDMQRRMKWIVVKIGGQLVRKYRLDYEYGAATGRSRLIAIQEYGSDGNTPPSSSFPWVDGSYVPIGNTLPVVAFSWKDGICGTNEIVNSGTTFCNSEFIPLDFNGDGKCDYIQFQPSSGQYWLCKSNGDGTNEIVNSGTTFCNSEFIPLDFNGDGKCDYIQFQPSSGRYWFCKSNGNGTNEIVNSGTTFCNSEFIPLDFNGDGKCDYIQIQPSSGQYWFCKSNGDGTNEVVNSGTTLLNCKFIPLDFNGDGKCDYIQFQPSSGQYWFCKSNGDGTNEVVNSGTTLLDCKFIPLDFNGDGKCDYIQFQPSSGQYWFCKSSGDGTNEIINSGTTFCNSEFIPLDFNGDGKCDYIQIQPSNGRYWFCKSNGDGTNEVVNSGTTILNCKFIPLDFNGDGKCDYIQSQLNTGQYWFCRSNISIIDLLLSVKKVNGIINTTYTPAPQVQGAIDSTGKTYPNIANTAPIPLVTEITYDNGLDNSSPQKYQIKYKYEYYNATIHTGFSYERCNLGFDWIKKTDENTGSYVQTYYYKDIDRRLIESKEETYSSGGLLYLEKDYCYDNTTVVTVNNTNPQAKFIFKSDDIIKNYNGEPGNPVTYQTHYTYDNHGNLIQKLDYGDLNVMTDDIQYDSIYDYNFENNLSLLTSLQTTATKLDGTRGLVAETDYTYKPNYLLDQKIMVNGAQNVINSFGYDAYGNVTSFTDGNNNVYTYQYDNGYQTFVRYKTNPKGQTEEIRYDDWMNPILIIDVNSISWQITYDVFSRKKTTISPGDDAANPTTRITYPDEFVDTNGNLIFPNRQKAEQKITGSSYLETDIYFDGFERSIQKKTKAQNGWITVDTFYDNSSRESAVSVPYFTTNPAYSTPDSNVKNTWKRFDPVNRVIESHNPDGTMVQTVYGKQEVKKVDENGHVTSKKLWGYTQQEFIVNNTREIVRISGNDLVISKERNPANNIKLFNISVLINNLSRNIIENTELDSRYIGIYPYQVEYSTTTKINFGDGIKTIDDKGNQFTDYLDMLGRMTDSINPVQGSWSYNYDGNNNPISQTDAKKQTVTMEYDSINRITKKTYPDNSSINYYYDENGHGYAKGRLTTVVYPSGSESYIYDSRGRKTAVTQTIDGISRTKSMTYNSMNQITTETYPDGEVVNFGFDQGGQVISMTGRNPYVSAIGYTVFDKISDMMYGNGVQTIYDYYDSAGKLDSIANTYYSFGLRQIRAFKAGNDLINITYQYDKVGNVAVKSDNINNNLSESYNYDEVNRLTVANAGVYGNKTFNYDTIDNILQKDGYNYQYDPTKPYTLINDGRCDYTYDANGSMIGRSDGRIIAWDYDNLVISISDGGNYSYNAQGQRLKKVDNNGVIKYYFFPEYEEEYHEGVLNNSVKYYFANKIRLAEYSSTNGIKYYTKDHLGSSSVISDANGNLVLRTVNTPYGSEVYNQGIGDVAYKFTDKEKDNTGLDYFGARYYDPEIGRFISVDPAGDGGNWYEYCADNRVPRQGAHS